MSAATKAQDRPLLDRIVDRFVPAAMSRDREARKQARMFLISHTAGPVMGNTVPLALALLDPTPHMDVAILALSISLFWVFPFLLRAGMNYPLLVILSVVNLNFCILWSCYHYGGVASPTLTWVMIIPLLALFYIGGEKRWQPMLLTVCGLSFAAFALAYVLIPPGPSDLPPAAIVSLGTVSMLATLCYVAVMAVYYARVFDAGTDLEREAERRRAMSAELRRAVIAADRASLAKTDFLARMSHELRTPLNAIIGYGQILHEEAHHAEDAPLRHDVDRILDAGHYLLRLIDTILDLSKIETGRMRFEMRSHRVAELLDAATRSQRAAIRAAGLELRCEVTDDLDRVEADEARVVQVIECILENAVRHTREGTIMVRARAQREAGRPALAIEVSDTGDGIAPELLGTIFNAFTTGRETAGGRYGGSGLKLAVCSQLCRAMGGSLTAESTPGRGSIFTLILPLQAPADAGATPPPPLAMQAG